MNTVCLQLFWEKRLKGLRSSDVTEQVLRSMDLPKGLQGRWTSLTAHRGSELWHLQSSCVFGFVQVLARTPAMTLCSQPSPALCTRALLQSRDRCLWLPRRTRQSGSTHPSLSARPSQSPMNKSGEAL